MASLDQTYTAERMKLVLDSTRLGMWDWNPQTNEVVFDENWAAMLGLSRADLTMTLDDWSSRVHADDVAQCFADINAHLEGKTPHYENIHRMRHQDGSWVYILDRGRVVERDAEGRATRFTGTHADLTPLKKAEFAASLALKAKDRFLSAVSHELRAPLHAIIGILDQLTDSEVEASRRALMLMASDSAVLLSSLVDDILDAARTDVAGLKANIAWFDLVAFVEKLHALFERRFDEAGWSLELNIDDAARRQGGIALYSDRNRLHQILINLLSNALKYAPEGGVVLSLASRGSHWALEVIDRGPGISDVAAAFEPFNDVLVDQGDPINAPNSTGLGLSICRDLSMLLDLPLEVESKVGIGTTMRICVPATKVRLGHSVSSTDESVPNVPDWRERTVMVVDDDPINRRLMRDQLSRSGATVVLASNGKEALRALSEFAPDIIFTDLHMPVMGGVALTRALRERADCSSVPIYVMSADHRDEVWPRCREAGALGYLEKPFRWADLFNLVAETTDANDGLMG